MNNCDFITCRYNKDGKGNDIDNRKECVKVARLVLCKDFAYEREINNR